MQMGRVKLKIQRLDSNTNRLTTYSKRKTGLIKKAEELSVLCDTDVAVLMFSPTGKPVFWNRDNSTIEGLVQRLAALTPQERVKRKLETIATLRKAYKNSDHEVIVRDYLGSSHQSVEDLTKRANQLRNQLSQIQQRLSDWNDLKRIGSVDFLEQMATYTGKLLAQIQIHKGNIRKQQLSAEGCHYQSHNGVNLPLSLDAGQQVQYCSWLENDGSQPKISREEILLLSKRGKELSVGNSFANGFGHLGTGGIAIGQENDIPTEFRRTGYFRNELIGLKTETLRNELTKTENLKNELLKREPSRIGLQNTKFLSGEVNKNSSLMRELTKLNSMRNELIEATSLANALPKPGSLVDELMKTESLRNQLINSISMRNELHEAESLRLQLCEQDSYPLYNFEAHPDHNLERVQQTSLQQIIDTPAEIFEPLQQMNVPQSIDPSENVFEPVQYMISQPSIDDFCDGGNFEMPPGYGLNNCNWASTSSPFVVDPFEEHFHTQHHYSVDGQIAKETLFR